MPTAMQIAVLNESTRATDQEVQAWLAACGIQQSRDLGPAWGTSSELVWIPKGQAAPANMPWAACLDNSDQAGALGYHELTNTGLPLAKIFVGTTLDYGDDPAITFSHEICEMTVNPDINKVVQLRLKGTTGRMVNFAEETCDAVEDDKYGYAIDSVMVSDFVLPAFFRAGGAGPWDFQKLLPGPCPAMLANGYLAYQTKNGRWHQLLGDAIKADTRLQIKARPHPGSRRHRLMLGRENWLNSDVHHRK